MGVRFLSLFLITGSHPGSKAQDWWSQIKPLSFCLSSSPCLFLSFPFRPTSKAKETEYEAGGRGFVKVQPFSPGRSPLGARGAFLRRQFFP